MAKEIQHMVDGSKEDGARSAAKRRRPSEDVQVEQIVAAFNRLSPRGLGVLAVTLIDEGQSDSVDFFCVKFDKAREATVIAD